VYSALANASLLSLSRRLYPAPITRSSLFFRTCRIKTHSLIPRDGEREYHEELRRLAQRTCGYSQKHREKCIGCHLKGRVAMAVNSGKRS